MVRKLPRPPARPESRKLLCASYAGIALAALVATWSQNVAYSGDTRGSFQAFFADSKVNPASRSITVDIVLFFLAAAIFMAIEARKHDIRFVWAYVVGGMLVAISVTFPLFLIARELRLATTDAVRLKPVDLVPLAAFAAAMLASVVYVDVL